MPLSALRRYIDALRRIGEEVFRTKAGAVIPKIVVLNDDVGPTNAVDMSPPRITMQKETAMPESFESTRRSEIAAFVGKHVIYTYENGWQYEVYIKNERTIDYRVHGGLVGGRWVKDQEVHIVRLADGVVKISWSEPTGTCVSVAYNFLENRAHGATFFPRWIELEPGKIVGYQNDKVDLMRWYRDAGPAYPTLVVDEFAAITFVEDCGSNDENVITCAPEALSPGYTLRRNVGTEGREPVKP